MEIKAHQINDKDIAEVISNEVVIGNEQEALDLLGNIYYQGFDNLIIHEKNITSDFFNLKNKMAGEILQKFSNYRVNLAIVVDVRKFTSKSLQDFIYESNKGKRINFLSSTDEALTVLSS